MPASKIEHKNFLTEHCSSICFNCNYVQIISKTKIGYEQSGFPCLGIRYIFNDLGLQDFTLYLFLFCFSASRSIFLFSHIVVFS